MKIIIEDNGLGIPEKSLKTIFNKYEQANHNVNYSTGLGLTFCKIVIEQHGGEIDIESKENIGTKIWFYLPETILTLKEQEKILEENKIIINKKEELKKFLPILRQTDIFQITNHRKIQKAMREKGLGNEQWVAQLSISIKNCNNEKYSNLLNILEQV